MTIEEMEKIQDMNRLFISSYSPEIIYSRDYNCPKIDIFSNGKYVCSTEASKTLKLAKARFLGKHWLSYGSTKVTAQFSK
jgi:hypothetical protein